MSSRIAPIRVILFFLFAACWAFSQSERPSAVLLQGDGSTSPDVQRQEKWAWRSLPDAPSTAHPLPQTGKFQTFADQSRSPFTPCAVGMNTGVMCETKLGYITLGLQPTFTASYSHKAVLTQKQSSSFFAPAKWTTFAPAFNQVHHERIHFADDLEYYGRRIPWAGPALLQVSQQAKAHPHITTVLMSLHPKF
jgi:hypothetical protein